MKGERLKMLQYVKTGGACRIIGCTAKTLHRWELSGLFKPYHRDPDGHRVYLIKDCETRKKKWEKELRKV